MVKDITIGLIYSRDSNWIAGSYYIENLVHALATLEYNQLPNLKVYSFNNEDYDYLRSLTRYPKISCCILRDNQTLIDKIVNKIGYLLFRKHLIVRGVDSDVDILFPADNSYMFQKFERKLFWIPDFQEKYFPQFFEETEVLKRDQFYQGLIKKKQPIVFSSSNAKKDFSKFYPKHTCPTFRMPFAVTLPPVSGINKDEIIKKHQIKRSFFICSNQFWAHKNHLVVIKAFKNLLEKGEEVELVFTGKMSDRRNPGYIDGLLKKVQDFGITDQVNFLGFVDRIEQLILMKNAISIIQPSKFEGWSTVVEDAKALNQKIIVSDLPVHREQLPDHNMFFEPDSDTQLEELMRSTIKSSIVKSESEYQDTVKEYGESFLNIVNEVISY